MTISIGQQIEEIEREIALRKRVYPNQVRTGKMRQSVADYHMERIGAVLETLKWLSDNRTKVLEELKKDAAA